MSTSAEKPQSCPFKAYDGDGYRSHCTFECLDCHYHWGAFFLEGYPRAELDERQGLACPRCRRNLHLHEKTI